MTEDEAFDAFLAGWNAIMREPTELVEDAFEAWWDSYRPEPPDILK